MKSLIAFTTASLFASLAFADFSVHCTNYRTKLILHFDDNTPRTKTISGELEDKEGYVTQGIESYEFYYDAIESKNIGGAVYVVSNGDYLLQIKLPKLILTKTPRKSFEAEFIPRFDGLRPRYNLLTCDLVK